MPQWSICRRQKRPERVNRSGVEQDYQQAAEWYLKSLNAGYTPDEEDQKHIVDVAGK